MGIQSRLKKPTHCTYCSEWTESPEIEHVVPRTWYPKRAKDSEMMKVPTCPACGDAFQRAEELTRETLALAVDNSDDDVREVYDAVLRSGDPTGKPPPEAERRRRRADRMLRNMVIIRPDEVTLRTHSVQRETPPMSWLPLEQGQWAWDWVLRFGYAAMVVDGSAQDRFFEKLIRGSYRYATGIPLGRDVEVDHFPCKKRVAAAEIAAGMRQIFSSSTFKASGIVGGNGESLWVFELFGQVLWFGLTGSFCQKRRDQASVTRTARSSATGA